MNGKKKDEPVPEFVIRTCSVPVYCTNREAYQRTVKICRTFQKIVSQLAAENFVLTLASSSMKRSAKGKTTYLCSDRNTKKELGALLYQANAGKVNNYELRSRFFGLWNEAREIDETLPEIGSWIWDAMLPKFNASEDHNRHKNLNELRVPKFKNFGLSILHCTSRKYASVYHRGDEDVTFSLKINNDPAENLVFIASGHVIMNQEQVFIKLNRGHESILKRISDGEMEWSNPTVRIDFKGRIFLDFSYKTRPRQLSKTGKTLMVLLRPYYDEENNEYYMCQTRYLKDGQIPDNYGKYWSKGIRSEYSTNYLVQIANERIRLNKLMDSARSSYAQTAKDAIYKRGDYLERKRKLFIQNQNHNFARQIVFEAERLGCDKISIINKEKQEKVKGQEEENLETEESVHGQPWRFFELKQFIKYKANLKGMEFQEVDMPPEFIDNMRFI
jgi:hypothetical protein